MAQSCRSIIAGMEETNRIGTPTLESSDKRNLGAMGTIELREGVLYLRSPERAPSAKSRMVLPHKLGLFVLIERYERTFDISRLERPKPDLRTYLHRSFQ